MPRTVLLSLSLSLLMCVLLLKLHHYGWSWSLKHIPYLENKAITSNVLFSKNSPENPAQAFCLLTSKLHQRFSYG